MSKYSGILLMLFLLFSPNWLKGQEAETIHTPPKRYKISLVTVGSGADLYTLFGHVVIRIQDTEFGTDIAYDYGNFNFNIPHFYLKFIQGELLYFSAEQPFNYFLESNAYYHRLVKEQVLDLPDTTIVRIKQLLNDQLKEEHKYFYYSFFFNNCATKVRDIFPKIMGADFQFGEALEGHKTTFREAINRHIQSQPWVYLGGNLLLGHSADKPMTNEEALFLPETLSKSFETAQYRHHPIVADQQYLLNYSQQKTHVLNSPLWMNIGIFILTILAFISPVFSYLKGSIKFLLLFTTGLLGTLLLFIWLSTDHTALKENYNILWAFPPNLFLAFWAHKKSRFIHFYGLLGALLILISLILSVIGFQKIPLIELIPLFLSLMFVYLDLWKQQTTAKSRI